MPTTAGVSRVLDQSDRIDATCMVFFVAVHKAWPRQLPLRHADLLFISKGCKERSRGHHYLAASDHQHTTSSLPAPISAAASLQLYSPSQLAQRYAADAYGRLERLPVQKCACLAKNNKGALTNSACGWLSFAAAFQSAAYSRLAFPRHNRVILGSICNGGRPGAYVAFPGQDSRARVRMSITRAEGRAPRFLPRQDAH
eukprot:6208512-Pleurochrysis_carterae.AAC.2